MVRKRTWTRPWRARAKERLLVPELGSLFFVRKSENTRRERTRRRTGCEVCGLGSGKRRKSREEEREREKERARGREKRDRRQENRQSLFSLSLVMSEANARKCSFSALCSVQRVYFLKRRADLSFRRCSSTFLAKGTAGAREGTGLLSEKKALLKTI